MTLRLLLVDDDPADVAIFEDYLEDAPFESALAVAHDGIEGIEALRSGQHDIVLLDLNMPRMNGMDALRKIRADPALKNQAVIVLTTSDRDEDIETAFEDKAHSFVTKPHDATGFENLMGLIHDVAKAYVWKDGN